MVEGYHHQHDIVLFGLWFWVSMPTGSKLKMAATPLLCNRNVIVQIINLNVVDYGSGLYIITLAISRFNNAVYALGRALIGSLIYHPPLYILKLF